MPTSDSDDILGPFPEFEGVADCDNAKLEMIDNGGVEDFRLDLESGAVSTEELPALAAAASQQLAPPSATRSAPAASALSVGVTSASTTDTEQPPLYIDYDEDGDHDDAAAAARNLTAGSDWGPRQPKGGDDNTNSYVTGFAATAPAFPVVPTTEKGHGRLRPMLQHRHRVSKSKHPSFNVIVEPALTHFVVKQRLPPLEDSSCFTGSSLCSSSTKRRGASSGRPSVTTSTKCPASSVGSARTTRSCAVTVRPKSLPRTETLPDSHSGRRHHCAPDRKIRIYLRITGKGGRLALWVAPDIHVGPHAKGPKNRFTDIWGDDAEERGPLGKLPGSQNQDSGRLTPFRSLLRKKADEALAMASLGEFGECDDDFLEERPSQEFVPYLSTASEFGSTISPPNAASLKELIEWVTGIPVDRQDISAGQAGMLSDHKKRLFECEVGHGALLYLTVRPGGGLKRREQRFLASPGRAADQAIPFSFERLQMAWRGAEHKLCRETVTALPDWRDTVGKHERPSQEPPETTYNEQLLKVVHGTVLFNTSDAIRGRFDLTSRRATQWAAQHGSGRVLPPLPSPATGLPEGSMAPYSAR